MTELNHNEWLWYVQRSDDEGERGPILRRVRIIAEGPKTVTIKTTWGARRLRIVELEHMLYNRTPEAAIAAFRERAGRWMEHATEAMERAERDLQFACHGELATILLDSEEEPISRSVTEPGAIG